MNPATHAHPDSARHTLRLSLKEHNVGFLVPPGATLRLEGKTVLPHGALIAGKLVGNIECREGSVIVLGEHVGNICANRVYVEGSVTGAEIMARDLFGAGRNAKIQADVFAGSFATYNPSIRGTLRPFPAHPHNSHGGGQ